MQGKKKAAYKALSQREDMTFEAWWKATDRAIFSLKNWTSETLFIRKVCLKLIPFQSDVTRNLKRNTAKCSFRRNFLAEHPLHSKIRKTKEDRATSRISHCHLEEETAGQIVELFMQLRWQKRNLKIFPVPCLGQNCDWLHCPLERDLPLNRMRQNTV